jgi:hypothetical protein
MNLRKSKDIKSDYKINKKKLDKIRINDKKFKNEKWLKN